MEMTLGSSLVEGERAWAVESGWVGFESQVTCFPPVWLLSPWLSSCYVLVAKWKDWFAGGIIGDCLYIRQLAYGQAHSRCSKNIWYLHAMGFSISLPWWSLNEMNWDCWMKTKCPDSFDEGLGLWVGLNRAAFKIRLVQAWWALSCAAGARERKSGTDFPLFIVIKIALQSIYLGADVKEATVTREFTLLQMCRP